MSERTSKAFHRRFYEAWLAIAGHFGEVQTTVILFFSYVFAIGPAAIVMARKDLLHKKELGGDATAWTDAESTLPDLERAKRLF